MLAVVTVLAACAFGIFWAPAMSLVSDTSERMGIDVAWGFAIANLAWAPGQATGAAVGGTLARATTDAVPYLLLAGCCLATLGAGEKRMKRLLVANRGEIAVRIFRTCRRLGIETVAVRRPTTRGAPRARRPTACSRSRATSTPARIVRAAREAARDAVHPGYGFLAESAELAEAVESAGIAFVGPTPDALRQGGDKLAAKEIAREAGVPVVPHGEPEEVGYPLVVKAAAGGGGRGMRVVRAPDELEEALAAAKREAGAAFGDDRVFCERYVERPRHVEIQLLADSRARSSRSASATARSSVATRRCSRRRRRRRSTTTMRQAMSDAAVAFGRAVGYRSAGTAEFMV